MNGLPAPDQPQPQRVPGVPTSQQCPQQQLQQQQQQLMQMHQVHTGGPVLNAENLTVPALLERLTELEQSKTYLEQENRQMHQQLQVLSGFLGVVRESVRSTDSLLFSAAINHADLQNGTIDASLLASVPSNSTATPAGSLVAAPVGTQSIAQQAALPPAAAAAGSTAAAAAAAAAGSMPLALEGHVGGFLGPTSSTGTLTFSHTAAVPMQPAGNPLAAMPAAGMHGADLAVAAATSNGDASAAAAAATAAAPEVAGGAAAGDGSTADATKAFVRRSSGSGQALGEEGSRKRARVDQQPIADASAQVQTETTQQQKHKHKQQKKKQKQEEEVEEVQPPAEPSVPQQASEQPQQPPQEQQQLQQQPHMQQQMQELGLQQQQDQMNLHLQQQLLQQQQMACAQQSHQTMYLQQQLLLQQHQQQMAAAAAAQMAAAAGQALPHAYGDTVVLQLSRIKGRAVLQGDDCIIYRVEVTRNGMFEKYVFLPNDAIPLYGMRSWQHRDAIPQELLKMVSGSNKNAL